MFHYGFVDKETDEMIDVRYGTAAARQALESRGGDNNVIIQPVMLRSVYQTTHRDFRGERDGNPWIVYMSIDGATVYGPVILLDHWGKWDGLEHHIPFDKMISTQR